MQTVKTPLPEDLQTRKTRLIPAAYLGLSAGLILALLGCFWAFSRGAPDFSVFFEAWKLTWNGQISSIYHATPDRFLYAPGFAWLFSPASLLGRPLALILWCLLKIGCLGVLIRRFSRDSKWRSLGLAALGLVILARPVLIDFQYGQVNLLILSGCLIAITTRTDRWKDALCWLALGFLACLKLFALPLLVLPWLWNRPRSAFLGVTGFVLALFSPILSQGPGSGMDLLRDWRQAIVERGFPIESHNQSFAACLERLASGKPSHVIALGWQSIHQGWALFSEQTILDLSWAWSLCCLAWIASLILRPASAQAKDPLRWVALLTGSLILPLYLAWKPYFLFGLPLAWIAVRDAATEYELTGRKRRFAMLGILFALINLTSVDVLGPQLASRFESASILLVCHIALLLLAARRPEALPLRPQV